MKGPSVIELELVVPPERSDKAIRLLEATLDQLKEPGPVTNGTGGQLEDSIQERMWSLRIQ